MSLLKFMFRYSKLGHNANMFGTSDKYAWHSHKDIIARLLCSLCTLIYMRQKLILFCCVYA